MIDPGVARRVQLAVLSATFVTLTTSIVADFYLMSRRTLAHVVSAPVPVDEPGEIVLSVVPLARSVERERFLLFFHRRTYLTTYRVELENRDLDEAGLGRLVVSSSGGRVFSFDAHPLLDPAPARDGRAGIHNQSATYAAAPSTYTFDLCLPPPGAVLDATVAIAARGQHVADQDLVLELGHRGGVLRARPVPVVWDEAD